MPLIALASVKGSPGVTTTCLALAAAWPGQDRLLIEADPSGGDLAARLGLPSAPGLTSLATAARRDHGRGLAWQHARELPCGLHLVTAPPGAEQARACLAALARDTSQVFTALAAAPQPVIADCGRLDPGSPALIVAVRAQLTLLMIRPRVSDLSHLALRAQGLSASGARLALLLAPVTGRDRTAASYPAAEIAATLGIPVQARIPADPRGAAHLTSGHGDRRTIRRMPLGRAAASLAAAIASPADQPQPPPAAGRDPAVTASAHLGGDRR